MREELLKGLSEDQIKKVKACRDHKDLLALAKDEGVELTNEQLEVVSGGGICSTPSPSSLPVCPQCKSNKNVVTNTGQDGRQYPYLCTRCQKRFWSD